MSLRGSDCARMLIRATKRIHLRMMMQPPRASTPTEVLADLVERVTFHNDENGFCVLRVKARGQRDLITVLGHAAMIAAGEFVHRSEDRRLSAQRGGTARLRSAGRRRDVDGRCAAYARCAPRPADPGGAAARRRCRSAAFGRTWAGTRRHHRLGCRAGRPSDRDLPPGRREPDRHQRAPDQPGPDA